MAFCTASDFVGNLTIDTQTDYMLELLNDTIARVEEDVLANYVLGRKLYNEFITGLAVLPTPLSKWTDLKNGKTYDITVENQIISVKYAGLADMLKYFVFYDFMIHNFQRYTNLQFGEQVNGNSANLTPLFSLPAIYNEGIKKVGFINNELNVYSILPTVFNFIYNANSVSTTYENWIFFEMKRINAFSI